MLGLIAKVGLGVAVTVGTALTPLGCNNPQPPAPNIYGAAAGCWGYDYDYENFPAGVDVTIYSTLTKVYPNGTEQMLAHYADHTGGRTHYINVHDVTVETAPFHAHLDLTWSADGNSTTNAYFDNATVGCT